MKILLFLLALPLLAQVPAVNSGTATYPSSGTICTTASCPGTVTSVVMAGTANQILVSGTCTVTGSGTCTFSLPNGVILGTDNVSAGTIQLANGSASAHTIWGSGATTTNTIQGFAVVPTTGHLIDCTVSSTTCLLHDSGVVTANVVTASSPGAGICHFAGSTQACTSSAVSLTADVTGTLPVANGGTGLATLTAHALYAGNATTAPTAVGPDASTTKALFSAGSSADPAFRAIASADLPATVVRTDQTNTYSTGAQDMGSATSHKVPTSAGAAPSASGQVAVDSTRGTFKVYDDLLATANPLETVPSIQLGSSDTLTCSVIGAATPTNFATTYTIPANTLIANKGFKVSVAFQVTGQGTPTFTFDMLLGTTVVFTGPSASANFTSTGIGAIFLVQGTAAAGASVNVNTGLIGSGQLGVLVRNTIAQPVAVATNANKAVTFRLTCSTNTAGNSVTLEQLMVESVN